MITTQLDHFFGKEHFRYLRPRSHYSIFESVRFCLKHDEAKYLFSICFQLSTLMRFCVKTHHFRCIFSSPFSKVSVFTCAYQKGCVCKTHHFKHRRQKSLFASAFSGIQRRQQKKTYPKVCVFKRKRIYSVWSGPYYPSARTVLEKCWPDVLIVQNGHSKVRTKKDQGPAMEQCDWLILLAGPLN